ncbi:hypothetical protein [Microbulbifer thermotolerans]|uniref:hypothetical protein n=1 Tax=Microbulbifer thermotolerans TaxID=252514 RepID=UPI00224877A5|nr:hypothetical protein [Microbulbifer thermotolerans]MCX2832205.1 hypothetical protein [Microbulbifer thermotolerans]MCX2842366.1 hypothetical protein [Microbulbifer thermotolerans]
MALPPGSDDALADHSGFTYQLLEAANGLSRRPPEELDELELLDELEELLDELELDELLEELELEELLDELEELLEELELPPSPYSNSTVTGTAAILPGAATNPKLT